MSLISFFLLLRVWFSAFIENRLNETRLITVVCLTGITDFFIMSISLFMLFCIACMFVFMVKHYFVLLLCMLSSNLWFKIAEISLSIKFISK